jgi:hypothetical protein
MDPDAIGPTKLSRPRMPARWLAVISILVGCALWVTLRPARPSVSLTCLGYQRWPHGANLQLTNGTQESVWYYTEPNGRRPIHLIRSAEGKVRRDTDVFSLVELKPGKTVDFFVYLEPDARPIRAGILLGEPPSPFINVSTWELWSFRLQSWLGIKPVVPGEGEIWSKPLTIQSSRQAESGK